MTDRQHPNWTNPAFWDKVREQTKALNAWYANGGAERWRHTHYVLSEQGKP